MHKGLTAGVALVLAMLPGVVRAQEGEKFDCVVTSVPGDTKDAIGAAMAGGGDEASREALFKQLGAVTDDCVTRHGIMAEQKPVYFDYSLARISREWLMGDIAKLGLPSATVDTALDFGPAGANPDLSGDMTEDQIKSILEAILH